VQESDGDYDEVLTQLLLRSRGEVGRAVNHLHGRLLWCQIDPDDRRLLRDRVILPAAEQALGRGPGGKPAEPVVRGDMVGLLALLDAPADPKLRARWDHLLEAVRADPEMQKLFTTREQRAQRQRANPPAMVRKVNFCGAASAPTGGTGSL
jgi:hypothetical protein